MIIIGVNINVENAPKRKEKKLFKKIMELITRYKIKK